MKDTEASGKRDKDRVKNEMREVVRGVKRVERRAI